MRSKKTLYNIGTNIILQILIIAYGFIVPKIIISSFGSDVNGLVSSITQFLAYITLLESGFGPVVKSVLYKPIANRDNLSIANILKTSEKFFRRIAYIFLCYIFMLCIIYPYILNGNFDNVYTISLILIIGICSFAEYFFGMTYKLFLQAEQKTYVISLIQISIYILSIISIIILAKLGASVQLLKLVSSIIFIFRPILQNLYVKKKYNIDFQNADSNYKLHQKMDGFVQHIAYVIHTNTDITVLTIFTSLTEVSVYSVYYLIVKGIKSLIQAFTSGIDATFGDMFVRNEKENLNKKFSIYEILYNMVCTVIFTCAIILIVPFVSVYTNGVTDANYFRPVFGVLIVISEYIWAIRSPYSSITLAAGHFKETRTGAWIECISNIIISIVLVNIYGLVGVAIGTIFAMAIRTIEFVYHTNKYILERSIWESIKKILLVVIETLLIVYICKYLPFIDNISYINWIINAMMVFALSSLVTLIVNSIVYRKRIKEIELLIKGIFNKKRKD